MSSVDVKVFTRVMDDMLFVKLKCRSVLLKRGVNLDLVILVCNEWYVVNTWNLYYYYYLVLKE